MRGVASHRPGVPATTEDRGVFFPAENPEGGFPSQTATVTHRVPFR
jgi:hypothetical protein